MHTDVLRGGGDMWLFPVKPYQNQFRKYLKIVWFTQSSRIKENHFTNVSLKIIFS